jgi:hypothetical protein
MDIKMKKAESSLATGRRAFMKWTSMKNWLQNILLLAEQEMLCAKGTGRLSDLESCLV